MSDFNVSRRGLIKAAGLTAAASSLGVGFAKSACAAEDTWDGYTICDSCNHMPMCGIHFKAKGNTVTWMGNWKEHPNNSLCSKGLSTLQRLYNPNRLLYPMKRTNPKGSADPGWVRISWDEAIKIIAENLNKVKAMAAATTACLRCAL